MMRALCMALVFSVFIFQAAKAQNQPFVLHDESGVVGIFPKQNSADMAKRADKVGDEQRHDLRREKIEITWEKWPKWEIVSPTSFRVFFGGGPRFCFGYRAEMVETDTEIQVAVISGVVPGAPSHGCPARAVPGSFLLHTQAPIGERKITTLKDVYLNDAPADYELYGDGDGDQGQVGELQQKGREILVEPALPLPRPGLRQGGHGD